MLLFSDLSYRMKDNARVFFMVAIISTVAFTAIGTLIGVNSYLTKEMRQANPISFIYFGEEDEDILKIEDTIDEHHITIEKANIELTYFELGDGEHELIVSEQTYNNFARIIGEKIIELPKDEIIVVQPSTRNLFASQFKHEEMSITMPDGTTHQPNKELFGIAKQTFYQPLKPTLLLVTIFLVNWEYHLYLQKLMLGKLLNAKKMILLKPVKYCLKTFKIMGSLLLLTT